MKKKWFITVLGFIVMIAVLISPCFIYADKIKNEWAIGINYPGLSVKYRLTKTIALEARAQYLPGIFAPGIRGYYLFTSEVPFVFYAGLEAGGLFFNTASTNGVGYTVAGFGGVECFIGQSMNLDNLTLSMDIGPAYLNIEQDGLSESGIDMVLNTSLNWYF